VVDTKKRNRHIWIFSLILGGLGFLGLILWLAYFRFIAYTDDAYVKGNQVVLTPLIDGFVTDIYTDDTFLVEKGQLLVQLDETDAKIALDDAKENLAKTVREVCQIFHRVFAYRSEIQARSAELIKAKQDWDHRIDVIYAGGVSLENLEHAEAALKANFFFLKETESMYQKEKSLVQGDSIATNPMILGAADRLKDAWVQLYRCRVYAPVRGLVAQRRVQVGMYLKAGDPMLVVIPLDQIWVNANYKETQMKKMRIGQKVTLTADLYGFGTRFHGEIVGLPGGAGNAFSLLPPQNLSGNWIKIVQRLPVRVALDPEELKDHPLRLGLSMRATTYLNTRGSGLVPRTSAGSPHYTTKIFDLEEIGVEPFIQEIIGKNLDPSLAFYLDQALPSEELETLMKVDDLMEWIGEKASIEAIEGN
jgi:membrane fusion protein (multidrug efflux system)